MSGASRSTWSPLARPLFRALWIASTASHVASYMADLGQGWLMSSLTASPLVVSLLLTAESLPYVLLGLPAGALADIVDRRRLLVATQLGLVVVGGTLAVVTLTGVVKPSVLLALAFASGTITALNDPAWYAALPDLLPGGELEAGVTLSAVAINIARMLGPSLGGFIVAATGPGAVFVLDALSFLGVVGVLVSWRTERRPSVLPAERVLPAIKAGLRFALNAPALQRVLAGSFLFMVCGVGVLALMPVLGRATGHGAVGFGLLLGSLGAGAVTGATLLPRVRDRVSPNWLIAAGSLVFAAVAIGAATSQTLVVLCPLLVAGGAAWMSVLSVLNVAAQQASPPWVRARALAVYLIGFQAAVAVGSALWGLVALRAGLSAAYLGIGGGLVAGALLVPWVRPAAREAVDHTPSHHWADPVVSGTPSLEAGPVMIQVEYTVDPSHAEEFRLAMDELGRNRRRDGAIQWWLFQDSAEPTRFVETWIEETWAEHLRNHDRVSVAHKALEERVGRLTSSPETITTRHFIAPEMRPSTRTPIS